MSRVGAVSALTVALSVAAATAHAQAPTVGTTFTLAGPIAGSPAPGTPLLGADGTAWLAQPGMGGGSAAFAVVVREANGQRFGPFVVSHARGTPTVDVPRGAVAADGSATFAWEEASGRGEDNPRIAVRGVRCTTRGCGAPRTFWDEQMHGGVGSFSFNLDNPPAEPAVATVGRATAIVYMREVHTGPASAVQVSGRMMWVVEQGSRFGVPHAFRSSAGDIDPVLVPEPGGRLLAAWLGVAGNTAAVQWSHGTVAHGFATPKALHGSSGDGSDELAAAPTASGAALAWVQGNSANLDPSVAFYAYPLWTASDAAGGMSRPVRRSADNCYGLTLAAGGGTTALAFSDAASSNDPPPAAPGLVSLGGGTPVTLDAAAQTSPAVAVDGSGEAIAAWRSGAGIEVATAPPGATAFSPAAPIAGPIRGAPEVVAGPRGTIVGWAASQGGRTTIVAAPVTP